MRQLPTLAPPAPRRAARLAGSGSPGLPPVSFVPAPDHPSPGAGTRRRKAPWLQRRGKLWPGRVLALPPVLLEPPPSALAGDGATPEPSAPPSGSDTSVVLLLCQELAVAALLPVR